MTSAKSAPTDPGAAFAENRGRLWSIAYRMLGSRADADDAVQDAYLRWHGSRVDEIRSPQAWLVTTVTRLCIDRLKQLRGERERYTGPWLPEPLVEESPAADHAAEIASDLSVLCLRCWNASRRRNAPHSCCTRCSTAATMKSRKYLARAKSQPARS
jgi:RNA polymerase sigma-70 factor (ECF subfamily)